MMSADSLGAGRRYCQDHGLKRRAKRSRTSPRLLLQGWSIAWHEVYNCIRRDSFRYEHTLQNNNRTGAAWRLRTHHTCCRPRRPGLQIRRRLRGLVVQAKRDLARLPAPNCVTTTSRTSVQIRSCYSIQPPLILLPYTEYSEPHSFHQQVDVVVRVTTSDECLWSGGTILDPVIHPWSVGSVPHLSPRSNLHAQGRWPCNLSLSFIRLCVSAVRCTHPDLVPAHPRRVS